ncbi:hypothetical protein [Streptomyces kebangsaanensis]|uniref:hypothetical protein n=1 Tax=Streptomyces kebangsaanensis TaxID=864058 RepID=UPI000939FC8D|nr:hypothetical protein [Streptomyces kebangsaanensis]
MATRAIIARPTGSGGFTGRYLHQDGKPDTAVGLLQDFVLNAHVGDVEAATRFLLDEHPNGWLNLPASDGGGECFCHNGDGLDMGLFTDQTDGEGEYAYVLHPDRIEVLARASEGWQTIHTTAWN